MPSTLLTPEVIAKETLMQLQNNLVMGGLVHRNYKKEFVKIGDTVTIRKPVKFVVNSGADITNNVQDVTEASTSITIDKRCNVAWDFTSQDLTLTIQEFSKRYLQRAVDEMAQQIDYDLCGLYTQVFNTSGTAGTTPNAFSYLGDLNKKMDQYAIPSDRNLVLDPAAAWSMIDALKGVYNEQMVQDFVQKGKLKSLAGMSIYKDQNIQSFSPNTHSGTPVIDTVSGVTYITSGDDAETSVVHIDGVGSGALKPGDCFTIDTVYGVNPRSRQSTGNLQEFVVQSAVAYGTDMAVTVKPAIITSGAYQTVTAAPVAEDAVTFLSAHTANLAFHENAFALVTVPLEIPDGVAWAARESADGVSIRVMRGHNILTDANVIRLDMLYGVKCIYPELACRLLG